MPSSTSSLGSRSNRESHRLLALWTGALAGPTVTLVLLQTNYVLSYVACETKHTWFLHLATAVAALIVAAAGAWAWRTGRGPIETTDAATAPLSVATSEARTRWMAWFAVGSTLWFIIVILSMSVPVVVLETCQ